MINRRAFTQLRNTTTRAGAGRGGGMPRFRPIAPKPVAAGSADNNNTLAAAVGINPCSKSSRKRSHSNASSSVNSISPASKRARCSSNRPLIPVTKPSSKSLLFAESFFYSQQQQPELKTLPLLPEAPAAAEDSRSSSPSSCQSSITSCSEDEFSLTELSLATTTTTTSSSGDPSQASPSASESSGEEEEAAAPRPVPGIDASGEFFEHLYSSSSEAMVLSNNRGGILWCNQEYKSSVSSGEELGLPIPVFSYSFGAVLWMFSRRNLSSTSGGLLSMNQCSSALLRPQPMFELFGLGFMADRGTGAPGGRRLAVVLSVVFYIIAGIPVWWRLTEVYRAPLPFGDVDELSNQVSNIPSPLHCQLRLVFFSAHPISDQPAWRLRLQKLQSAISEHLQKKNPRSNHCRHTDVFITTPDAPSGHLCSHQGDEDDSQSGLRQCGLFSSGIHGKADSNTIDEALRSYFSSTSEAGKYTIAVLVNEAGVAPRATIGRFRHAWVDSPPGRLDSDEFERIVFRTAGILLGSTRSSEPLPISADGSAVLSFSLLNANPNDWVFDWEFDQVEARYLAPLVEVLAPVVRLSIESQVLYYTPSAAKSQWSSKAQSYLVDFKQASFFVNANEWHLDTSSGAAGRSKLLHFAIYIPAKNECPLQFRAQNRRGESLGFTSPGWGGVIVWNPPNCSFSAFSGTPPRLKADDLSSTIELVVTQLRALFGLQLASREEFPGISNIPNLETGFADWELDSLLRHQATADIKSAGSTLASLLKLVKSLPKMVIQDEIAVQVKTSLEAAQRAVSGQDQSHAGFSDEARKARAWADAAFFHPSIMSLLHFPKEHQFAIYTPFFAPVLLHTMAALVKEAKRYMKKKRS